MQNNLKRIWSEGGQAVNGWLSIPNAFTAEIMTTAGYDSLTVDMQHGLVDYQAMTGMLQAMHGTGVAAMVRVPWLDPAHLMKALDAGADGVICPMISTREQAEALVSYTRYPPLGARSIGPIRARYMKGSDYIARANEDILVFAMIETAEGMENLPEIAATPGLDGIYIGPSDLTMSLSNGALPVGLDREEPEMVAAIETILSTCKDVGLRAALHTGGTDYARRGLEWGFDLVTHASDIIHMATGAAQAVDAIKEKS